MCEKSVLGSLDRSCVRKVLLDMANGALDYDVGM